MDIKEYIKYLTDLRKIPGLKKFEALMVKTRRERDQQHDSEWRICRNCGNEFEIKGNIRMLNQRLCSKCTPGFKALEHRKEHNKGYRLRKRIQKYNEEHNLPDEPE